MTSFATEPGPAQVVANLKNLEYSNVCVPEVAFLRRQIAVLERQIPRTHPNVI